LYLFLKKKRLSMRIYTKCKENVMTLMVEILSTQSGKIVGGYNLDYNFTF